MGDGIWEACCEVVEGSGSVLLDHNIISPGHCVERCGGLDREMTVGSRLIGSAAANLESARMRFPDDKPKTQARLSQGVLA